MQLFGPDPFANIRKQVRMPVQHMRTFELAQPLRTHFRRATCTEADCANRRNGWRTGFDLTDPDRAAAARWVRDQSGRRYSAEVITDPATGRQLKVIFTFPAGQECLERHHLPLERDPFMLVRRGDFRGNPDGTGRDAYQRHTSADSFLDHWSSDLDKLTEVHKRG